MEKTILTGTSYERVLQDLPISGWEDFVHNLAVLTNAKSKDYDYRFLHAMVDPAYDSETLWRWEVDKKLDRLRSWWLRGELEVQGEGVRNSIDDLISYTVQYYSYIHDVIGCEIASETFLHVWQSDTFGYFKEVASDNCAFWIDFLLANDCIDDNEYWLQLLLQQYMGVSVGVENWQRAIHEVLKPKK